MYVCRIKRKYHSIESIIMRFLLASGVCSVQPSAIVVVVGETVFLNCAATEGFSIRSWQIGLDIQNRTVVYTAQLYGRNGTLRAKKSVADGYSVTNETENKVSLYIRKIKCPQAGLYVCQCGDHSMSIATTVVVVLGRYSCYITACACVLALSYTHQSFDTVDISLDNLRP